jgi:predicted Zn-dependent protease
MHRFFVLLGLVLALGLMAGCAINPVTGKRELSIISEQDEIELGREAAPEIEQEFGGLYPDPGLQAYVNGVGLKVAQTSHRPHLPYEYAVLNTEVINALALPGGKIYITRGLLVRLDNEAELAAVLGHETGHVTAKHSVHHLQRQLGTSLILTAIDHALGKDNPTRLKAVAQVSASLINLSYSRDDEYQADELGVEYAYGAGYDPRGMLGVLQALYEAQQREPSDLEEFMHTHPLTSKRIEEVEELLEEDYAGPAPAAGWALNEARFQREISGIR